MRPVLEASGNHLCAALPARLLALSLLFVLGFGCGPALSEPSHAIAMHGQPAHSPGFSHFDYVNPRAPKGGALTLGALGSFDSLNPLIVKGKPAQGLRDYVFESLMARGLDEPFSLYGLIAKTVETPPDRSWVEFTLDPRARFSDGRPVTVKDVLFSHALLRDHGRPNHRHYYSKVTRAEQTGEHKLRFTFLADGDREMPLIMGLMPVLPEHVYGNGDFEQTSLAPPVGSGPYVVTEASPTSRIIYKRNPDYWGRELSVNRGRFNFDTVTFEYFRDSNALLEAFIKGIVDVRPEDDPTRWFSELAAAAKGSSQILRAEITVATPAGMSAYVLNMRRGPLSDPRIRQALILLFDFETVNRLLYAGAYERTQSYFARSELSSHGRPAGERERELLKPWADLLTPEIMAGRYALPNSDGQGANRANRRMAARLLARAGFRLEGGRWVNGESGAPLELEILVASREQERLALAYARSLKRSGITAATRYVDSAQYQRRLQSFDFDIIEYRWYTSLSPGNEQRIFWGSESASQEGSRNYAGIQNEGVDAMIDILLQARDRKEFVAAARALDRLLIAGHYVIPLFHLPRQWVARWSHIRQPKRASRHGYVIDAWWHGAAGRSGAVQQSDGHEPGSKR